jgi:hypothetical protein
MLEILFPLRKNDQAKAPGALCGEVVDTERNDVLSLLVGLISWLAKKVLFMLQLQALDVAHGYVHLLCQASFGVVSGVVLFLLPN